MDQRDQLYQAIILDHFRQPRFCRPLKEAEVHAEVNNPACGDRIRLTGACSSEAYRLEGLAFEAQGCAICVAGASLLLQAAQGQSVEAIQAILQRIRALVDGAEADPDTDGDLAGLRSVSSYPLRRTCATLGCEAMERLIDSLVGKS